MSLVVHLLGKVQQYSLKSWRFDTLVIKKCLSQGSSLLPGSHVLALGRECNYRRPHGAWLLVGSATSGLWQYWHSLHGILRVADWAVGGGTPVASVLWGSHSILHLLL